MRIARQRHNKMAFGFRWSGKQEIMLINFYKEHRNLWCPEDIGYYSRTVRNAHMLLLAEMLENAGMNGITVKDIKLKYHNLRTTYRRLCKAKALEKFVTGSCDKPTWVHFQRLNFLSDTMAEDVESDDSLPLIVKMEPEDENSSCAQPDGSLPATTLATQSAFILPSCPSNGAASSDNSVNSHTSFHCPISRSPSPALSNVDNQTSENSECNDAPPNEIPKAAIKSSSTVVNMEKNARTMLFVEAARKLAEKRELDGEDYFAYHIASALKKMKPEKVEMAKLELQQVICKYLKETDN